MSLKCPHCSQDVGDYVPKERLDSQKAALTGEITLLKARAAELEPKANQSDALAAELATVKGQFESFTARATRTEILRASGLDPSLLPSLEALHGASQAAAAEGAEVVAFDAWLQADDGAKAHPLLRHMFQGAPPASSAAGVSVPPPVPPARKPPADTGRTPAGQPKMSPEQLQGYYQSAEFKGKKPDERRAIIEQHKREFLTVE